MTTRNFSAMGSSGAGAGTRAYPQNLRHHLIVVAIRPPRRAHSLRRQVRRPTCSMPRRRETRQRAAAHRTAARELQNYGLHGEPAAIAEYSDHKRRGRAFSTAETAAQLAEQIETGARRLRAGRSRMPKKTCRLAIQLIKRKPRLVGCSMGRIRASPTTRSSSSRSPGAEWSRRRSVANDDGRDQMSSAPILAVQLRTESREVVQGRQKLAQTMGRGP